MFKESVTNARESVRPQDLVIPALLALAQANQLSAGPLTSTQIKKTLAPAIVQSPADREKTSADDVDRFGRSIRNLVSSHSVLVRMGVAKSVRQERSTHTHLEITPRGISTLCDAMLPLLAETMPSLESLSNEDQILSVRPEAPRATERSLLNLSLLMLAQLQSANAGKPITTTLLRRAVKGLHVLSVSPEDIEVLPGRKDTRIDQVLRNLFGSNDTLAKSGLATRSEKGLAITSKGKAHLLYEVLLPLLPQSPVLKEVAAERAEQAAPARRKPGL